MIKKIKGTTLTGRPYKPKGAWDQKLEQKEALLRLRQVVGAFLYLREKRINDILVAQVDRIGKQLERIENELVKNPRKEIRKGPIDPATQTAPDVEVTFAAWKKMDLKAAWFGYMDDIYKNRKAVALAEMKKLIGYFKDAFPDSNINKLKADIDKEEKSKKPNQSSLKTMKEDLSYQQQMQKSIDKLDKEWTKAQAWPKPGWNK